MGGAKTIIKEVKNTLYPSDGVKVLAQRAYDDPEFCIMDNDCYSQRSYRQECLDRGLCHRPDGMTS